MKNSGDFSIGSKVWPGAGKVIEEAGELIVVMGKLIGQVEHRDGKPLLMEELADTLAAIDFFMDKSLSTAQRLYILERAETKRRQYHTWHNNGDDPRDP